MSATVTAVAPATVVAPPDVTASLLQQIIERVDAIGVEQKRPSPVRLRSWEEIERFAEKAARSGMVPKDYIGKADAICIAVQMGSELGLAPMQAVQNIAVINGRPSIWGDAMIALCRASPLCASIVEWTEGEGDDRRHFCKAVRKGEPNPVTVSFSVADAKLAGLWKTTPTIEKRGRDGTYTVDAGPWYHYPDRMMQMRARGFALRDAFPDVLKGLLTAEEAEDYPIDEAVRTAAVAAKPPAEPLSRRDEINRDVPMNEPPRRTIGEYLDALERQMRETRSPEERKALIASPEVQHGLQMFRNGAKARLETIIALGEAEWAEDPEEPPKDDETYGGWPGPDPDEMRRERDGSSQGSQT